MWPIECSSRRSVAGAVFFQQRAITILDLDRPVIGQQLLHPALQLYFGLRKFQRLCARGSKSGRQTIDGFRTPGCNGYGNLGGFMLDCIEPMGVAGRVLKKAVARTE